MTLKNKLNPRKKAEMEGKDYKKTEITSESKKEINKERERERERERDRDREWERQKQTDGQIETN